MKPTLAQSVVEYLSFSKEQSERVTFEQFSRRDWQRVLSWLHDTGLALYFLHKVIRSNQASAILPSTLVCLKKSLQANRRRTSRLGTQFELLNHKFEQAGVVYAAVKGLTLVPQFCPEPYLRHQSDFDYLVDDESLSKACSVLERAGYTRHMHDGPDYVFHFPSAGFVPNVYNQYSEEAPFTVELHLSLWGSNAYDIFLDEPHFCADRTVDYRWGTLTCRSLREEDLFLLLVTHIFYHISSYWLRLSWLYEMGYFLSRRATDSLFWTRVDQCMGSDPLLREIVALVTTLVKHFFAAPIPPSIEACPLRPAVRVWIQHYSRVWAFAQNQPVKSPFFPPAKLTLFLLEQYAPDAKRFIRSRLLPLTRLSTIGHALKRNPERILDEQFRRRMRIIRRAVFHLTAGLRYLCERPRWGRLNKLAAGASTT